MDQYLAILPFIFLSILFFYLGLKKRNYSNSFHIDYILIHLIILIFMSFFYFGIKALDFPLSFFDIINQLHIASLIAFILHVESAIRGFKSGIKKYFVFAFLMHFAIILINFFGIQLVDYKTNVEYFMLLEINDPLYFTDKILVKGTAISLLVFYLIRMCYLNVNNSLTINRKNLYKFWVYTYCFLIIEQMLVNKLYYFGFFEDPYIDYVNILVRFNAITTLMFIFINPAILNYLPIIKSIKIYSRVQKHNYFQIIQIFIKKEKLYLRKKIKISDVSSDLGISIKNIRASILLEEGVNFNDFINKFRIEESTKLIKSDYLKTHTVIALGEKSGFNSHQSFFRAFKKVHNTTPTIYSNLINKKGESQSI